MKLSNDRVEELLDMEAKLEALESGGVANWDGYFIALIEYNKAAAAKKRIEIIFDAMLAIIVDGIEEPEGVGAGCGISPDARIEALNLLQNSVIPK